jgi:hypothetical protein
LDEMQRAQWFYAVQRSGFTRYKSAPPCLRTGTDREVLAVWVVACVEHARAAAGGSGRQNQGWHRQSVNLQAFIMIRRAGEPGLAPSALASLGMIEESGRGAPSLIDGATSVHEFC